MARFLNMTKVMDTKSDEAKLRELSTVEKEFRNHWIWRELDCTPEIFFLALDNYLRDCPLSNFDRERGLEKLKQDIFNKQRRKL